MAFDSGIITFTTKTDKVDLVAAAHINAVQAELVIIETILGVGVKGNQTNLKTRLDSAMDSDGTILSGSAFPSPAIGTSQGFWRTDLNSFNIWTGTQWKQINSSGGIPTNMQVFTSSGTWTQPPGVISVFVKVIGAGGNGGNGGGAGTSGGGGGGGAGGYSEGVIAVSGNVTVTIGATNSFAGAVTIQATAGGNGGNGSGVTSGSGGTGGVGSNGTVNLTGAIGDSGSDGSTSVGVGAGGIGGSSPMGGGGGGGAGGGNNPGAIGATYGGGGGGASGTSTAGGTGNAGAVIVYWVQ